MLINIIGFQVGWFACVLSATNHYPWWGVLVSSIIMVLHIARSNDSKAETRLIIAAMLIGLLFDSIPLALGWINFSQMSFWADYLPPVWMICLWGLLATTINTGLSWLKNKIWLAAIIGGLSGPISYWGGSRLGGLQILNINAALVYLTLGWALAVPLLLKISVQNNKKIY